MNGTELRDFSHFQILTWIAYSDLSRNLQIDKFWCFSSFTVKLWKSVKMIIFKYKDDLQVFSLWMEKKWEVLVLIKFWPSSHTQTLAENLKNWLIFEFFFIHCKTAKVSQNDQIRMWRLFTSVFLMNRTELRSFSHFQILTWIVYSDLTRNR